MVTVRVTTNLKDIHMTSEGPVPLSTVFLIKVQADEARRAAVDSARATHSGSLSGALNGVRSTEHESHAGAGYAVQQWESEALGLTGTWHEARAHPPRNGMVISENGQHAGQCCQGLLNLLLVPQPCPGRLVRQSGRVSKFAWCSETQELVRDD